MISGRNNQRSTFYKEDAASQTTAFKLVLLTSTIGVEEVRYVSIVDIPNELIQTSIEDEEEKVFLHMLGNLDGILMMTAL